MSKAEVAVYFILFVVALALGVYFAQVIRVWLKDKRAKALADAKALKQSAGEWAQKQAKKL